MKIRALIGVTILIAVVQLTGCAPEVGSERWCNAMKEKSKGDWTASEAADFTKHCIFR